MTMRITMVQTRMGESGSLLTVGNTYTVSDAFGAAMVGYKYATDTDSVLNPISGEPARLRNVNGVQSLVDGLGIHFSCKSVARRPSRSLSATPARPCRLARRL